MKEEEIIKIVNDYRKLFLGKENKNDNNMYIIDSINDFEFECEQQEKRAGGDINNNSQDMDIE